ncbi:MAG: hypothetical protein ACI3W5_03955 [Faecousia sp.]
MSKKEERQYHFGVLVVPGKYGLRLCRENYAIIDNKPTDKGGRSTFDELNFINSLPKYVVDKTETIGERTYVIEKHYTDEWCKKHYDDCMKNFDLNMKFYKQLDKGNFEKKIESFLKRYKCFKPVTDLKEYAGESGYYLMVLDEYRQIYIGTSDDIMKRIQTHWRARKKFDRLVFRDPTTSRLSIDSFRALDTTRIYAYKTWNTYEVEDKYINFFPDEYICNRISGGRMELGSMQVVSSIKHRKLNE